MFSGLSLLLLTTPRHTRNAADAVLPCPTGPSTGPEALSRALQVCPDLAPEVRQLLAATNPANVTERGLYMHDFDSMGQVRGAGWKEGCSAGQVAVVGLLRCCG